VDIVLQGGGGRAVAVEVELSATPSRCDFSGPNILREDLGDRFVRGIPIHTGREIVPFGKDMHAVPVSALSGGPGAQKPSGG